MSETLVTTPPEAILTSDELVALVQKVKAARPTIDDLVSARLAEAATITAITSDEGQQLADKQLKMVVDLRNQLKESDIRKGATLLHRMHSELTRWIGAWDKLLETRERSLSQAMAKYQQQKEQAAERERQRLQRLADEDARQKREAAQKEAERRAKEELDAAEQQRQNGLIELVGYLGLVGEKKAVQECLEMAKERSANLNQVRQDIEAVTSALESMSKGQTAEALAIMQFTQNAPPPPPPPAPVVEYVAPTPVFVPSPVVATESMRGLRWEPHAEICCEHEQGNGATCANCAKVPRHYFVLDWSEIRSQVKRFGQAGGGTREQPNTTLIPGLRIWWEQVPTLNRSRR